MRQFCYCAPTAHSSWLFVTPDVFLPLPEGLLVNLQESKELVIDLLTNLPAMFEGTSETSSALGGALQAAFKLMVGAHSCRLVS